MTAPAPVMLLAIAAVAAVAFARSLRRRGALGGLAAWWRGASPTTRTAASALFLSAVACGSDKAPRQFGQGLRSIPRLPRYAHPRGQWPRGSTSGGAGALRTHNLAAGLPRPPMPFARRGAHGDGFWLRDGFAAESAPAGVGPMSPAWVHTDGTVSLRAPAPELPLEALPSIPALSDPDTQFCSPGFLFMASP